MKKMVSVLIALVMALACVSFAEDGAIAGGWNTADSFALTDDAKAAFDKALEGYTGVGLEPIALCGTQVVAGINYSVLCKATVVVPNAPSYFVIATVYADLEGNATFTDVETVEMPEAVADPDTQNPVMNLIGFYMDDNSQRASMFIETMDVDGAAVEIRWASSAFEDTTWKFTGRYDTENGWILYSDCVMTNSTYADDGTMTSEVVYENGMGALLIADDYSIVWVDCEQNAGEGSHFVYSELAGE